MFVCIAVADLSAPVALSFFAMLLWGSHVRLCLFSSSLFSMSALLLFQWLQTALAMALCQRTLSLFVGCKGALFVLFWPSCS